MPSAWQLSAHVRGAKTRGFLLIAFSCGPIPSALDAVRFTGCSIDIFFKTDHSTACSVVRASRLDDRVLGATACKRGLAAVAGSEPRRLRAVVHRAESVARCTDPAMEGRGRHRLRVASTCRQPRLHFFAAERR